MASEDPTRKGADSPSAEDRRTERAILALLLHEHPSRLTMAEVALVLHGDSRHPDPPDDAERAIGELVSAGLLRREGKTLTPTRAVLHFDSLEMD